MSFLYVKTDTKVDWALYWINVQNGWIEFCTEFDKEPFFIYPVGLIDVRQSDEAELQSKPNVLEIFNKYQILGFKIIYIFSYDVLDIIPFFTKLNQEYEKWQETYSKTTPPLSNSYDFKSKAFIRAVNLTWHILPDKIVRSGSKNTEINFDSLVSVSAIFNPNQKDNIIKVDYNSSDQNEVILTSIEQKCVSLAQMRDILGDFYINFYIYSLNHNNPRK